MKKKHYSINREFPLNGALYCSQNLSPQNQVDNTTYADKDQCFSITDLLNIHPID